MSTFAAHERLRLVVERKLRAWFVQEFKRVAREAAAAYPLMNHVFEQHAARVSAKLKDFYLKAYNYARAKFKTELNKARQAYANPESAAQAAEQLSVRWTAKRSAGISETTRALVNDIITAGLQENLSLDDIAKEIQSTIGGPEAASRALIIARTESHSAVQAGAMEAAQEDGMKYKEWIATNDERTRDSHRDAHGQVVSIDEPFDVGGVQLDYPGDPSGPPEEVINCRCVVRYRKKL